MKEQSPPQKPSAWKTKILPALRTISIGIVVLGLLIVEFGTDSAVVRYVFYGMIAVYLGSIGLRAFRYRKHILYHFAPGTKEALGDEWPDADKILKSELTHLSEGYEIGFVKSFANEFRQIDKSARDEATAIDKILDFVEYAFPFQSNLISVISKPLKNILSKRSFRISIARSDNGSISLNAFSQNEATHDIHVDRVGLQACLREAACRMFHELHANDLTPNYNAFHHYNEAFHIWESIYQAGETDTEEFENAAQQFRLAIKEDPDFLLAALYLAAMNAYRRTNAAYLERSKIRLNRVIQLCDLETFPGPQSLKNKYKGLATVLLCFLSNQWLHRMGKYDNEEQAILIARDNQHKAHEATKLLKNSPIAIHQYAFSLHSLEQIALSNPQSPTEIATNYAKAYDQYSLAIKVATKNRMPDIVALSTGNRAYVSMWLGAMLLEAPDKTITLRAFGNEKHLHSEAAALLWQQAETDMKKVYAKASGTTGHYSIANLILLYALMGRFEEIPPCGLLLTKGIPESRTPSLENDSIHLINQLSPEDTDYPEGANDLGTALLTACASGTLPPNEYASWLDKGLAFQKRCLDLIQEKETQNVEAQRIRIVKQITNLLKILHYTKPDALLNADRVFQHLRQSLETIRTQQESISQFVECWIEELQTTLRQPAE